MSEPILKVENMNKKFGSTVALNDVSLSVYPGEIRGLIGENGSGKSTVARCIMNIYKPSEGEIFYKGIPICKNKEFRKNRKMLQMTRRMIFQDSASSLNPRMKIEDIVAEPLRIYSGKGRPGKKEIEKQLELVGLDRSYMEKYPCELSGGQRQRVAIARALSTKPELIVADEPIASLDVSIQAQVVNLMKDIQQETGTAYLFIAHDLSMVKYISDRIGVLHLGHLLETGTTEEIFEHPIHPYTRSLLSAIPLPNPVVEKRRVAETYDYATSGIDYSKGTSHHVEGSHYVKCTDEEFAKWCK